LILVLALQQSSELLRTSGGTPFRSPNYYGHGYNTSYLLLRLLHLRAYFEYCSAYASTLGGAYFAVKNVSKALVFAHRQQLAARRMQNAQVAMRAKMHIILDHYALGRQTLAKTKTQLVQLWRQARIRQMPTMARALTATLSELQVRTTETNCTK